MPYDPAELIPLPDRRDYLSCEQLEAAIGGRARSMAENVILNAKPLPLDAMLMEFVPNGDLSLLIKQVNAERLKVAVTHSVHFPNKILWKIFLCCEFPILLLNPQISPEG